MCLWLQHQQLPANENSLATAVTGRQVNTIMQSQERDYAYTGLCMTQRSQCIMLQWAPSGDHLTSEREKASFSALISSTHQTFPHINPVTYLFLKMGPEWKEKSLSTLLFFVYKLEPFKQSLNVINVRHWNTILLTYSSCNQKHK